MLLTPSHIAQILHKQGFRNVGLETGVAIVLAESGGNTSAVSPPNRNGTIDYGMWQINSIHKFEYVLDPIRATAWVWGFSHEGTSWTPWSVFNNLSYLTHLDIARKAIANMATAQQLVELVQSWVGVIREEPPGSNNVSLSRELDLNRDSPYWLGYRNRSAWCGNTIAKAFDTLGINTAHIPGLNWYTIRYDHAALVNAGQNSPLTELRYGDIVLYQAAWCPDWHVEVATSDLRPDGTFSAVGGNVGDEVRNTTVRRIADVKSIYHPPYREEETPMPNPLTIVRCLGDRAQWVTDGNVIAHIPSGEAVDRLIAQGLSPTIEDRDEPWFLARIILATRHCTDPLSRFYNL
jgi:Lysozyme like domain